MVSLYIVSECMRRGAIETPRRMLFVCYTEAKQRTIQEGGQ